MERFEDKVADQLLVCYSETALTAVSSGITWAKYRDEKLNSIHLLYGLLCVEDSIGVTILYQSGYRPFEVKRLLVTLQAGTFEGPFPIEAPFLNISNDLQAVIEFARERLETLEEPEIDTAYLLLGIVASENHAHDVLAKGNFERLEDGLQKFIARRES